MQKKNEFFFSFSSASTFGETRGTKSRVKYKRKTVFLLYFRDEVPSAEQKTQLDEQRTLLAEKDASLQKSIQLLHAANMTAETIAASLGMDVDTVKCLMVNRLRR